jgi:hypothetical protein
MKWFGKDDCSPWIQIHANTKCNNHNSNYTECGDSEIMSSMACLYYYYNYTVEVLKEDYIYIYTYTYTDSENVDIGKWQISRVSIYI